MLDNILRSDIIFLHVFWCESAVITSWARQRVAATLRYNILILANLACFYSPMTDMHMDIEYIYRLHFLCAVTCIGM